MAILQQRRELFPGFIRHNGMLLGLHIGLLFAADTAGFHAANSSTPSAARFE